MRPRTFAMLALATMIALSPVQGNRGSVKISVPQEIKEGENFTITLEISHNNNNDGHYVEWVRLHADNVLIREWTFDPTNFVADTSWTLAHELSIEGETEIKAKANCNLHGGDTKSLTLDIGQIILDEDGADLTTPLLIVVVVLVIVGLGFAVMRRR